MALFLLSRPVLTVSLPDCNFSVLVGRQEEHPACKKQGPLNGCVCVPDCCVAGLVQDTPGLVSHCWPVERLVSNRDSDAELSSSGSRSLSCDTAHNERHFNTSL